MHRCARCARFSLMLLAVMLPAAAQRAQAQMPPSAAAARPEPDKEKLFGERHQAALAMLEQVVAGARSLSLPQNRIAIASEAFPLLWSRNEPRARSLVNQMIGDFAQAAGQEEQTGDRAELQLLRQQRQTALQAISPVDAELALSFMNATRSFVQVGDPEQEEAEERGLRLGIAAQEAVHNPRNALRMAEKDLQAPGELPPELISLLGQITAQDPEAGAQLLREVVDRVRSGDLSSDSANFNFALSLLRSQADAVNGGASDPAVRTLADAIIAAAQSPQFPPGMRPPLEGWLPTLERIAPGPVSGLQPQADDSTDSTGSEEDAPDPDPVQQAQASGDPGGILDAAEGAPRNLRSSLYRQAAWRFAGSGDLQRAHEAADHIPDPDQRDQVLGQMIQQAAWNACNQGNFAAAWQLVRQLPSEDDRAALLAQFAANAARAKQPVPAEQMIEEAVGLLASRSEGASTFLTQLQVARAFVLIRPARALSVLDRSASQLDQVLAAVAQVDAFLPARSFAGGELRLSDGFLFNSMIRPFAEATAQLASYDLSAARTLADRISCPEARLMAELLLARNALYDTPQ